MLKTGILNPEVLQLMGRFRHTNTIVIADRGFPFWPTIPTIDLSLIDNIPTVRQVLEALLPNCVVGHAYMAQEFRHPNDTRVVAELEELLEAHGIKHNYEPHLEFKKRTLSAIGLIRTGDTTQFANIILESA